ncbi:hypothetical protein LZ32DRAFT_375248 [Colletotrichum eremochloae]|nr:hypothetical protein LZ32DRAFT_375248 [Colletotrichum eremochloae]
MASHRKAMRKQPMMIMTFTTCFHSLAPLVSQDILPTEMPYPPPGRNRGQIQANQRQTP